MFVNAEVRQVLVAFTAVDNTVLVHGEDLLASTVERYRLCVTSSFPVYDIMVHC